MKIGIVGSGVVGFATGRGFVDHKHDVMFYDVDKNRVKTMIGGGAQSHNKYQTLSGQREYFLCMRPDAR